MKFISVIIMSLFITAHSVKAQSNIAYANDYPFTPRITTENGIIEGIDDSGVYIFKGIPYAQPPVGRFTVETTPTC